VLGRLGIIREYESPPLRVRWTSLFVLPVTTNIPTVVDRSQGMLEMTARLSFVLLLLGTSVGIAEANQPGGPERAWLSPKERARNVMRLVGGVVERISILLWTDCVRGYDGSSGYADVSVYALRCPRPCPLSDVHPGP